MDCSPVKCEEPHHKPIKALSMFLLFFPVILLKKRQCAYVMIMCLVLSLAEKKEVIFLIAMPFTEICNYF